MSTTEYSIIPDLYRRLVLKPLGLNSRNAVVLWLLLLFGGLTLMALWFFQGKIMVTIGTVFLMVLILTSLIRMDFSLYLLMFAVLFFDQFGIPYFDTITYRADYFKNLKEIRYIPFFEAGMINPIELHLLFLIFALFLWLTIKKDFSWRPIPVLGPFLFFVALFVGSFVYGISNGGDFLVALWEVRALFYLFLIYLIVPQIIRTKSQIQILVWIFIVGISLKAFQGIRRFINIGFTTGGLETLTNHEDPVFIVTLLLMLLGFLLFKVKHKQKWLLLLLLFPLLLGFYVGLRRAAYASFMVAFVIFVMMFPPKVLWRFVKLAIPCVIVLVIYVAAFWNNEGRLGRPIQMIKTGFERPTVEESYKDYYSNLYRDFENYNLAQTVVEYPVFGMGFGNKYEQPIPLAHLTFPLRDYIPHNEIFWIIVKMGAVGFFAFWFFFNAYVAKAVKVLQRVSDPYLKVILMVVIIAVINQMVVSFFDLQLTYYRNMIYLGCLMGLLPTIEQYVAKGEPNQDDDKIIKKDE